MSEDDQPMTRPRIPNPDPRGIEWREPHEGPPVRTTHKGGPITAMGRAMKALGRGARQARSHWRQIVGAVVGVALFVGLMVAVVLLSHASHAREGRANVERVREACGNGKAEKFKIVYGNEPSAYGSKSREWAERCYLEGR